MFFGFLVSIWWFGLSAGCVDFCWYTIEFRIYWFYEFALFGLGLGFGVLVDCASVCLLVYKFDGFDVFWLVVCGYLPIWVVQCLGLV